MHPIETAPRDREIIVYAPSYDGLPALVSFCQWHPDAGFCIDELRKATHWIDVPGGRAVEKMDRQRQLKLLARMMGLHAACRGVHEWHVEREPHPYQASATHFTHVAATVVDANGDRLNARIASHLTDTMAEALVLAWNNLPEIVALARRGIEGGDE